MALPPDASHWDLAFRSSPFRLRFELGGETFGSDAPVPRFVQAFGRARQLASEAFERSRRVCGIVASWPDSAHDLFAPAEDGFQALAAAGFAAPLLREWAAPLGIDPDDDERVPARWRAFDLTGDLAGRDVLLWCSVAYEMAVSPKAPVMPFLADFERGLLLHVYDDRGMDLTALGPDPLLDLYRSRSDWLLDHDRERMRLAFE
ncbi:MAG TPA: DUF3885 domain-containing protein [Allosphingosinicella sp.]